MRGAFLVILAALAIPAAGPGALAAQAPGSVPYLTGGIGADEQERLRAREKEFNLKLVFTLVEGNYLSDVDVVVSDAKGAKLLERSSEGPFFLMRLPAGRYTVAATHAGKTVTRKVAVDAKHLRTEYLRWPSDPKADLPVSRWLEPAAAPAKKPAKPAAAK